MKKSVLLILFVAFFSLSGQDNSVWIPQPGWVTGPGSGDYGNMPTYLLPFGMKVLNPEDNCWKSYNDETPLLYETDMGWPVPDESGENLKYLLFGDTFSFKRNGSGDIMNKITDGDPADLIFNLSNTEEDSAEISADDLLPFLNISDPMGKIIQLCEADCLNAENQETCKNECPSYTGCKDFCDRNPALFDYYTDFVSEDECESFCKFAVIDAFVPVNYFSYWPNLDIDPCAGVSNPSIFTDPDDPRVFTDPLNYYNNGTSNIFLAAELVSEMVDGNIQYKVHFKRTYETGGFEIVDPSIRQIGSSHQLYEKKSENRRKSKSIWMNNYERNMAGFVGIYPRGYFYACAGSPSDGCQSQKLFIPYGTGNWYFLNANVLKYNINADHVIGGNPENLSGDNLITELDYQTKKLGLGIYDFEDECRIKFSPGGSNDDFPSCQTAPIRSNCSQNNFPNKNILWPMASKMANTTIIQDLDLDPLSPVSESDKYIYFMGTGETIPNKELFPLNWTSVTDADGKGIIKTQKAYVARVPAYESEIKCASSYEYFSGIFNGISNWSKDIKYAEPLYSFYPMDQMGAESIIKHRGLYWMTAPLNETKLSSSGTNEKGVVVLASPDGFHWQKMDKILFDNPESIGVDYAFFWLPSKLIDDDDNTMPFLYSIWKSNIDIETKKYNLKGFLDPDLDPKFTHYNLKMGKYEFSENNPTGAFLVNSKSYGHLEISNIPGVRSIKTSLRNSQSGVNFEIPSDPFSNFEFVTFNNGTIELPFKGFQNLENLDKLGQTGLKENMRKRYVMVEYCDCGTQTEEDCKKVDSGHCPPFEKFLDSNGNPGGNWNIIKISDQYTFKTNVKPCIADENIPDYMCNIPFEHSDIFSSGVTSTPVWEWRKQIVEDTPNIELEDVKGANVILRFSHWYDKPYIQANFTDINSQLVENNKIVPYDCEMYSENDPDPNVETEIEAACKKPDSWKTTRLIAMRYREPEASFDLGSIRIEYLFPYPVMIKDFGGPGDPAHKIGDLLVANHLTNDFFKVSSFEYGQSAIQTLTPGFAMTSIMDSSSMHIYAWGGMTSSIVLLNNSSTQIAPERVLFTGSFDPETETVTMEQSILTETAGDSSPSMTAGASMVYDEINNKIYLIGAPDKTGVSRIYRLDKIINGPVFSQGWVPVAAIDSGTYFRLVKKSEREYFVVGGLKTDGNFNTKVFLLNLDDISSPQLISNIPDSGLANSFAAYNEKNGKLYLYGGKNSNGTTNRFISLDTKTLSWNTINTSNGPGAAYGGVILVDYVNETLSLGGGNFENPQDALVTWTFDETGSVWTKQDKDLDLSYCLNETNDLLKGGLGVSGICAPFTHPWYRQFSAGATVYSVAGKGDRLYVGTSSSIKVYDISNPAAMTLKYTFSTSNRIVYDLEVADGDIMYAATSSGIYKLNTANPDTLTSLTFYSTGSYNYQYKIQLYNDKLYVGDDNGINIRDKNTFTRLAYVNTGSILDFAIADGEIAMYWSAFWDEGIQIRDADTLNMKAYDYATCYTGELTADHGEFYLSCDDYEYRFVGLPNTYLDYFPVDGDIREMQENYAYNGWAYIPDGSYVKLSTSNDVPAVCGNGVTEPGELCDGNSVECTTLDPEYTGGTAACNSTCNGYNENNCEVDGW